MDMVKAAPKEEEEQKVVKEKRGLTISQTLKEEDFGGRFGAEEKRRKARKERRPDTRLMKPSFLQRHWSSCTGKKSVNLATWIASQT